MNTLVSTDDVGLPGADMAKVDAAVAAIRAEAGWHIAPVLTETLTVNSWGEQDLFLPSQRVVTVAAVRHNGSTLTGWTLWPSGILFRPALWPIGVLEVDLSHGYEDTPPELLQIIAGRARTTPRDPSIASQSIGQTQVSYRDAGTVGADVVARFSVRRRVA